MLASTGPPILLSRRFCVPNHRAIDRLAFFFRKERADTGGDVDERRYLSGQSVLLKLLFKLRAAIAISIDAQDKSSECFLHFPFKKHPAKGRPSPRFTQLRSGSAIPCECERLGQSLFEHIA
jgi:hypothetical protein